MPKPRVLRAADLTALSELLDGIFRRSRGVFDQSMVRDFPLIFQPSNFRNCRVVEVNRRIVSHAAVWPRELLLDGVRLKVGTLASVATHPDYRHRKFAGTLVQSLMETLREEAFDLGLLWTAVPDFYLKLGWQLHAPRGVQAQVSEAQRLAPSSGYDLQPYTPEHFDAVAALHEREPVRFMRSPSDFATLLTLPKVQPWLAFRDGMVRAYLIEGRAINKQGLIEYCGELEGLVALAARVVSSQASPQPIPWLVYPTRPDLAAWIAQRELPTSPLVGSKGASHEMILPLNATCATPALLERLFTWGLDHV